jgi:hypothetical protein
MTIIVFCRSASRFSTFLIVAASHNFAFPAYGTNKKDYKNRNPLADLQGEKEGAGKGG